MLPEILQDSFTLLRIGKRSIKSFCQFCRSCFLHCFETMVIHSFLAFNSKSLLLKTDQYCESRSTISCSAFFNLMGHLNVLVWTLELFFTRLWGWTRFSANARMKVSHVLRSPTLQEVQMLKHKCFQMSSRKRPFKIWTRFRMHLRRLKTYVGP